MFYIELSIKYLFTTQCACAGHFTCTEFSWCVCSAPLCCCRSLMRFPSWESNQTESLRLSPEKHTRSVFKQLIDSRYITALILHLLWKLQIDVMMLPDRVWADVQNLTQFQYTVAGPLEAALANTVWAVHQKEDIHGCWAPHHCAQT